MLHELNLYMKIYNVKHVMAVTTQQFYNLLSQGYVFRLLRVNIRLSNELTQDYLIHSALWVPVALTVGGVIVVHYELDSPGSVYLRA